MRRASTAPRSSRSARQWTSRRAPSSTTSSKAAAALDLPDRDLLEGAEAFRAAEGELVPALCELIGASMDDAQQRKRMKAW
jgi:hypothetical protein